MDDNTAKGPDYSKSLFLPKTEFPMRAGLPKKEPEILQNWEDIDLYGQLREKSKGRPKFVLHDGPPYANGNIHIGHALNKILKDIVIRSQQMLGKDSNYVPGWDCHGLPIEWKIEAENYRAKGKPKPDLSDPAALIDFRQECRASAQHWLEVQRDEFIRLGITGDWDNPYTTMSYPAETQIAREIMKFAENGLLYRGSKPVMWSVVEQTALAEAEIEYEDYTSDTVFVAFPVKDSRPVNVNFVSANVVGLKSDGSPEFDTTEIEAHTKNRLEIETSISGLKTENASIVIWTTTPWTIPGNRAISYSHKISYGLYQVTEAAEENWAKVGATYILADALAGDMFKAARVEAYSRVREVTGSELSNITCAHPLASLGYDFDVPLFDGDHVTADTGTGFVHTAPGHGRDDFEIWMSNQRDLIARDIDTQIPSTVAADGSYTKEAPGFEGKRVIDDKGKKGDANDAVIKALVEAGNLVARGRLKHQYPHSWRSKKPIIFRNTPQWFIAMDQGFETPSPHAGEAQRAVSKHGSNAPTLRDLSLAAIKHTRWVPAAGENRITGMIEAKPDWVVSRQRAWGVPICVFVKKETNEILRNDAVNAAIAEAFENEGADCWYAEGAKERFLDGHADPADYDKIDDVLDVWFDSGSTHAFTLEDAVHFPGLAGIDRIADGGKDEVMYLEGSDQHRGWFHSSLIESCGTRGRAPYDVVLTHGFVLDEKGQKMSKSLGNVVAPQTVIKDSGADILRLWVAASDYSDDLRIGKEILKNFVETYRKLRNTTRWMLGTLAHYGNARTLEHSQLDELERLMLHRLAGLDKEVRQAFENFDYKRVIARVTAFMNTDLSAFYFDIRKDALYCEPPSSKKRLGTLQTIDHIFRATTLWLAPVLAFTAEESWRARYPQSGSVHLEDFSEVPEHWHDPELAAKWEGIRKARSVVTGALEIERANKRMGSSLEAAPVVHVADADLCKLLQDIDFAEICITSAIEVVAGEGPEGAFRLDDIKGVAVETKRAEGVKCARSWKYFDPATAMPGYPDVTARDAAALQELKAAGLWS